MMTAAEAGRRRGEKSTLFLEGKVLTNQSLRRKSCDQAPFTSLPSALGTTASTPRGEAGSGS